MKSTVTVFIAINVLISLTFAGEITSDQSRQVAKNLLKEKLPGVSGLNILRTENIKEEGLLVFRIHYFDNGGYVLVSAQNTVRPVLAYSLSSDHTASNPPPAFEAWIGQYARQIHYAVESGAAASEQTNALWMKYLAADFNPESMQKGKEVTPMLISTWDQGQFYNLMCPADPAGPAGHCYTGCVATAMGQLCNYFRWPDTGVGSYTYQHPDYGTISANFGETGYQWNEMTNAVTGPNMAVATLLYHLGVSVDMDYGPDGSGMWNHKAAYSLRTYFKYSPETEYLYRDSTNLDWDSTIVAHLDQGIPMYYAGWSVPNVNGHAFIVDGYQTTSYFHFNWGWSGSYDGYFYLDELTPGGSNFNLAQELIIHCAPDTNLYVYPPYCSGGDTLRNLSGTIDDGSYAQYNYQDNTSCSWLIDPQNQYDSVSYIKLTFDRLQTEPGNDKVTLYDGPDATAPLLGVFSGDSIPAEISSTGNKVFITFETNSSITDKGWFLSYKSVTPVWCNGITTLTDPQGTVSDGSGAFNYKNGTTCMWLIEPPFATDLTLTFTTFETEANKDVVKIYDAEASQLLAQYSGIYSAGNLPDPVTSPSGKMLIAFSSDPVYTQAGWEAGYTVGNVGMNEQNDPSSDMIIYPNPADDRFNIYFPGDRPATGKVSVLSISGQEKIKRDNYDLLSAGSISLDGLGTGIYYVKVITGQRSYVFKLIKK